ncbi:MAG: metallophosphoesterase [Deltaproteobacteria bacterium]|nr:metallophosphoesterase [Deltaproteobacteria bacterium]
MGDPSPKIVRFPETGPLLVCTDLHGNLPDFLRMKELFLAARAEAGCCQLLFLGDLVHGPAFTREEWPDYLGSFYVDHSAALLEAFMTLQETFPGEVHCLLGNHEHSHVGGPHTPKFWLDETAHFEQKVGPIASRRYRALFSGFPLIAISPCGVVFSHAAPNISLTSLEEIEAIEYLGHERMNLLTLETMPMLGRLLWARRCPTKVVQRFLEVVSAETKGEHGVVVYGHDIAPSGFEHFGAELLMLSTSFGLDDPCKTPARP